jgi:hypothetical protein
MFRGKIAIEYAVRKQHKNPLCRGMWSVLMIKLMVHMVTSGIYRVTVFEGERIRIFLTLVVFGSL